jgi:hypothetical protein
MTLDADVQDPGKLRTSVAYADVGGEPARWKPIHVRHIGLKSIKPTCPVRL